MPHPIRRDFVIIRGDTFRYEFALKQKVNGVWVPIDVTGCIARWQLRDGADDEVLIDAISSTGNAYIDIDGPEGSFVLTVEPDVTEALDFAKAVHDFEIEWPDGTVETRFHGSCCLHKDVTR